MAPLLHLMSVYGLEQRHNVHLAMSERVFVKIVGLLVTFSKGLLRNHTAADGTVDVLMKRNPLEFVLNRQCQSNIDFVSSASFLMIVCTDAVSVAANTVAIQPLFSCGIVQNLPLPNTLKDKQKYILAVPVSC